MCRLQEIQEEYAKEKGYSSFFVMYCDSNYREIQNHNSEITEIYAEECIKASLQRASENVRMKAKENIFELSMMDEWTELDRASITEEINIILL